MRIPHIIHQTWKNDDIPSHFEPLIATWKEKHPGWTYILWTDEMNRSFIKDNYPDFLPIYDNYPYHIQRVDAVRYFILFKMGGVFVDLDFECLENIDLLIDNKECVFGIEPKEHCVAHNKEVIICNAFMACKSGNDFFHEICKELKIYDRLQNNKPYWIDILESTGPFKLTDIYNNYCDKSNITLISSELLYPVTLWEIRDILKNSNLVSEGIQEKIDRAYAVHYFLGTWW